MSGQFRVEFPVLAWWGNGSYMAEKTKPPVGREILATIANIQY